MVDGHSEQTNKKKNSGTDATVKNVPYQNWIMKAPSTTSHPNPPSGKVIGTFGNTSTSCPLPLPMPASRPLGSFLSILDGFSVVSNGFVSGERVATLIFSSSSLLVVLLRFIVLDGRSAGRVVVDMICKEGWIVFFCR